MKTAGELLAAKGTEIWSVAPNSSVFDAIKLMADKNVGALIVMSDEKMVGIISERDYARKVILQGRSSQSTQVDEIMTTNVVCGRPDLTIEECMALVTDKRIRHLPIAEQDRLLGMVSIGDLVKTIIAEQQFTIQQLESYIRA